MKNKLTIAFYAGTCLPIHARSLEERPLGGTETGLIRVAALLQERGHEVTVFTSHRAPPESKPRYIFHENLLKVGSFDVLVTVQQWKPLFYGARAKRAFFWTGDGFSEYANFGIGDLRVVQRIEKFLAVSNWHANSFSEKSGFPRDKAHVVGNGVQLQYFNGSEIRNPKRLIYSSAPYRGLVLLPKIFQDLKKSFPELELHVFSAMKIYDTDKPYQGREVAEFERIKAVFSQMPGCVMHGNVVQSALARELMKSAVYVYPNFVRETCCITAMEAQAAGCAIVTSDLGALPETTGDAGFTIGGEVGSPQYLQQFSDAVRKILNEPNLWKKFSDVGLARSAKEFSWERVTDRFEQALEVPVS